MVLWLPVSLLLGVYLDQFAKLNAVYGPISGVMSFYLRFDYASIAVILAAETGAVTSQRITGAKGPLSPKRS